MRCVADERRNKIREDFGFSSSRRISGFREKREDEGG